MSGASREPLEVRVTLVDADAISKVWVAIEGQRLLMDRLQGQLDAQRRLYSEVLDRIRELQTGR